MSKEKQQPEIYEYSVRVRFNETDQLGIAHHTSSFIWFEEGRIDFLRSRGLIKRVFFDREINLPVDQCSAKFYAPVFFDQLLTVKTIVKEISTYSLTFTYEIIDANTGQLLVTGKTKHACVDDQMQLLAFSDEWIELLGPRYTPTTK